MTSRITVQVGKFLNINKRAHSTAVRNLMKVWIPWTGPSQGYRALLGDSEYIFFEILAIRAWDPQAAQHSRFCQIRPNRLCCLAGGFHALISRISKNIYSESPNNARSPCEGPVHGFYTFIRFLTAVLCVKNKVQARGPPITQFLAP